MVGYRLRPRRSAVVAGSAVESDRAAALRARLPARDGELPRQREQCWVQLRRLDGRACGPPRVVPGSRLPWLALGCPGSFADDARRWGDPARFPTEVLAFGGHFGCDAAGALRRRLPLERPAARVRARACQLLRRDRSIWARRGHPPDRRPAHQSFSTREPAATPDPPARLLGCGAVARCVRGLQLRRQRKPLGGRAGPDRSRRHHQPPALPARFHRSARLGARVRRRSASDDGPRAANGLDAAVGRANRPKRARRPFFSAGLLAAAEPPIRRRCRAAGRATRAEQQLLRPRLPDRRPQAARRDRARPRARRGSRATRGGR